MKPSPALTTKAIRPAFVSNKRKKELRTSPPSLAHPDRLEISSATPVQPKFSRAVQKPEQPSLGHLVKAGLSLAAAGAGVLTGGISATSALADTPVKETLLETAVVTEIPVSATDPSITQARGPHYVVTDNSVPQNGYLLLSLGGTNSLPKDFLEFDKTAARQGFVSLALDYPNTVITTSCKHSTQPDACTLFREEINSGAQVSELVEVDHPNSIEYRLEAALRYQALQQPEHFAQFVNEDGPVWNKIVVVGHSQGSGHAGYLAKKHPMQGVILLAGPQDTTDAGPASWLSAPSATDPKKYLAFLHKNDFFGSELQLNAVRTLRENPNESGFLVDFESPDSPIVVSEAQVRDGHMSVITPQFTKIWEGLLQRSIAP